MPVMSFIQEDDPWLLAFYRQNELRYVEPGDEAEIFMKVYPGRIIKCKVDSILWVTAQGQLPIRGNPPNTQLEVPPENRIAVRLLVEGKDKGVFLAAGARGGGADHTNKITAIQILRRVIVRITAKFDWFVIKHLPRSSADTKDERINALRSTLLLAIASSLVLAGCALKNPPFGAEYHACIGPRQNRGHRAGPHRRAP